MMGKGQPRREKPLFWKMNARWPARENQPYHWVSYAIVDQNWKLLTNTDASYIELYDIVADPYEKTDLKEGEPRVAEQLLGKLDGWKKTLPAKPSAELFSAERSR